MKYWLDIQVFKDASEYILKSYKKKTNIIFSKYIDIGTCRISPLLDIGLVILEAQYVLNNPRTVGYCKKNDVT